MADEQQHSNAAALAVAAAQPPVRREIRVVENSIALFDTAKFEHMNRIAAGMARASLIPEHLAGERNGNTFTPFEFEQVVGNCLLITNQAMRWDVDPFALAAESYVVRGKLGFQGKLIQAIIEDKLKRKLKFRYNSAKGDDFAIVVYLANDDGPLNPAAKEMLVALAENDDKSTLADLQEDHGIRAIRLSVGQAKTENKIWRNDPEQKLVYSGSTKWARRYEPGIIMGIRSDDDIEKEQHEALAEIPKAALPPGPSAPAPARVVTDEKPEVVSTPKRTAKAAAKPAEKPAEATSAQPSEPAASTPAPAKETPKAETPAPAPERTSAFTLSDEPPTSLSSLRAKLKEAGFTDDDMLAVAQKYGMAPATAKTIADIPTTQVEQIVEDWENALAALQAMKGAK